MSYARYGPGSVLDERAWPRACRMLACGLRPFAGSQDAVGIGLKGLLRVSALLGSPVYCPPLLASQAL